MGVMWLRYCRFFKVDCNTNWLALKEKARLHESNMKKKIPYRILASIVLSQDEFEKLCKNIQLPHCSYMEFATRSIAGLDGIWNCILVCGNNRKQELIIYTAGQIYPLYVGIND